MISEKAGIRVQVLEEIIEPAQRHKLLKEVIFTEKDLQNQFIISGIIDKFSIQFELGWKVLKELLVYEAQQSERQAL